MILWTVCKVLSLCHYERLLGLSINVEQQSQATVDLGRGPWVRPRLLASTAAVGRHVELDATQPESWTSFYHPSEGEDWVDLDTSCSKGIQTVYKAVYRSGRVTNTHLQWL